MAICHRVRVDDARRVRVRAYGLSPDAYVRACAPLRLRGADARDADHRANARANALLLHAYVCVRVPSFSLLLLLNV